MTPHAAGSPGDGAVFPSTITSDMPESGARLERVKRAFRALGPGLITGASDDDPSGSNLTFESR